MVDIYRDAKRPSSSELILYSSDGLTLTLLSFVFMRKIVARHLEYKYSKQESGPVYFCRSICAVFPYMKNMPYSFALMDSERVL